MAFAQILTIMGEPAIWESSTGEEIEGRILFKDATKPATIGASDNYEYPPEKPIAEWYRDTFVGLKEQSDKQLDEYLIIRGQRYFVLHGETKFDGDTYIANLEKA